MRITFFGTSHGVPEANRKCSSSLIEAGGKKYLIDAGTNPIDDLVTMGLRPEAVATVFITHLHGDHTDGLVHFDAMLYEAPLREYPPKLFCFNHYSPRYEESCRHLARELDGTVPVIFATDGRMVDL